MRSELRNDPRRASAVTAWGSPFAPREAAPRTWRGQAGQGMIEYALIGGILIVGAIAVLTELSKNLNNLFSTISSTLAQY